MRKAEILLIHNVLVGTLCVICVIFYLVGTKRNPPVQPTDHMTIANFGQGYHNPGAGVNGELTALPL